MRFRILGFILLLFVIQAKDRGKFKTCSSSEFCSSHRNKQDPEYAISLIHSRIEFDGTRFRAPLHGPNGLLNLHVYLTMAGAVKVEIDGPTPRWKPDKVFVDSGIKPSQLKWNEVHKSDRSARYSIDEHISIDIEFEPFKLTLLEEGAPSVIVNGFKEFYYKMDGIKKIIRNQDNIDDREIIDWGEDGKPIYATEPPEEEVARLAEDSDSLPSSSSDSGNELGIDVSFIGSMGLFGLPERTLPLNLPNTRDKPEPYRLYNLDVFEYEIEDSMGIYGNIPILVSKGKGMAGTGILWNNPSDTYVDLSDETLLVNHVLLKVRKVKWMSEAGNFDLVIYPGPSLPDVLKQIRDTTGPQLLPPMFSLGYHQCRWNYNDQKDFLQVNQGFEKHNIPMDVLWLDIEHTDGRRYFTFDKRKFPDPLAMYKEIDFYGRKAVNIVDPHIKRDNNYFVHKEASSRGFYLKDHEGNDFDGWCWPGSSSYIDFSHEPARKFWASMFDTDKYKGSLNGVVHIWNDMNEPSVFNADEVTMPKDCKNLAGAEFRELHNVWGMYFHSSSQAGLLHRDLAEQGIENDDLVWRNLNYDEDKNKIAGKDVTLQRGFVLSRAFYVGSQRSGAIWTGDNTADWSHLQYSVPMLLSFGMAGLSFIGADVGGFFGDPSPELLVRWYQAGALQPFFRGHAHIDTKRREPWLFGEENTNRIRSAISLRYRLLPYIYTSFYDAERTGMPVMRPLFMNFPNDDDLLNVEDQWMLGTSILVAPVLEESAGRRSVRFPKGVWYHVETHERYTEGMQAISVDMNSKLAYYRAGYIIPQKIRMRRATKHMRNDPYTLIVALEGSQIAHGNLYIDDEKTYDYADKDCYCKVDFEFRGRVLTSRAVLGNKDVFAPLNKIEKIVILGAQGIVTVKTAKVVTSSSESEVEVVRENEGETIVIRNPRTRISEDFSVSF